MSRPAGEVQQPSTTAWWKHLRAPGKRELWKRARKAMRRDAVRRVEERA